MERAGDIPCPPGPLPPVRKVVLHLPVSSTSLFLWQLPKLEAVVWGGEVDPGGLALPGTAHRSFRLRAERSLCMARWCLRRLMRGMKRPRTLVSGNILQGVYLGEAVSGACLIIYFRGDVCVTTELDIHCPTLHSNDIFFCSNRSFPFNYHWLNGRVCVGQGANQESIALARHSFVAGICFWGHCNITVQESGDRMEAIMGFGFLWGKSNKCPWWKKEASSWMWWPKNVFVQWHCKYLVCCQTKIKMPFLITFFFSFCCQLKWRNPPCEFSWDAFSLFLALNNPIIFGFMLVFASISIVSFWNQSNFSILMVRKKICFIMTCYNPGNLLSRLGWWWFFMWHSILMPKVK